MAGLKRIEGYEQDVINICPNDTMGEIIELEGLLIQLPSEPDEDKILFSSSDRSEQYWRRQAMPAAIKGIRSMDEWAQQPSNFRKAYRPYIEQEFKRRSEGVWLYIDGKKTYITGTHYFMLQWVKIDGSFYGEYLAFQRTLFIHAEACKVDPRCVGQLFTKCRRSGYTNMAVATLLAEGTVVKDKVLGIMSKTGGDARDNVFMKKVVSMYRHFPFFFKPIQDGSTNPRVELAFREPAKKITKNNKTAQTGEALNTIINWKNTTNNAYDGERLYYLFLDEAGKWEKPADVR